MTAPLTAFLIALLKAPVDSLAKADPQKLAEKYGIQPNHAAAYLRLHSNRGE